MDLHQFWQTSIALDTSTLINVHLCLSRRLPSYRYPHRVLILIIVLFLVWLSRVNAVHGVALNLPKIHHKTTRFFLSVMSHRAESYVISMFMYIQYVHVLIYGSSRKSHHPRQAMYSSIYNVSSNKTQVKSFKPSQITKESHSIGEFQTSRICHGSKSYTLKPIIALPEKTSANFSEEKFPHPKFHLRRDRYRRRGWSRLEIRMVPDDPVKRPPRLNSEWFKL